jgi:hypothetical protein
MLQENMKQAQGEFKELNRALKDITFSSEEYEFLYMPSKKYRSYYEMIMDDFNMVQGESIFSGIFHEAHREVIDELFDRLAVNNENNAKTLDEFTDYRTYMDYDIKIIHRDGSYSYYSKVCEEKSGGETQTPFYVTVAASFVHFGDIDVGGFEIYRDLCRKTGIPFQTYHMGIYQLEKYKAYSQELTDNDRKRLDKLIEKMDGEGEDTEVLKYMKETGRKLEQEGIGM